MAREVSETQCKALESRHGIKAISTSVVSNLNIGDAVSALYEFIADERKVKIKPTTAVQIVDVNKKENSEKKGCKC